MDEFDFEKIDNLLTKYVHEDAIGMPPTNTDLNKGKIVICGPNGWYRQLVPTPSPEKIEKVDKAMEEKDLEGLNNYDILNLIAKEFRQ